MMFKKRITILFFYISNFLIGIFSNNLSAQKDKDPFSSLGIPDLNPKSLLNEIDEETTMSKKPTTNTKLKLKSIEDLPNFLKNNNLDEGEGIKILSRFLIQDDFTLKKFGVVYDQTGFDGIGPNERIAPIGTEERLMQRAKSSSNIWFKDKYPKLEYDAYGAEPLMDEIVPNWRIYKVLMIGKNGENTFMKVCVPLDESETALCSDKDELCGFRAKYVEKEKKKNEDYISKIKSNNFFKRKPGMGKVKLLPGEKIVVNDKNKKIVLDSSTINNNNEGFFNPPSLDKANKSNDPLLNAFKNKNNVGFMNNSQAGMGMNQGFTNQISQTFNQNPNGINSNLMNPNNNPANNYINKNSNFNQFNQGFINNEALPQKSTVNTLQTLTPVSQQSYNFKQKDNNNLQTSPQIGAPNLDNTQLLNEIMQMKTQLNQMMVSMKQKDEIINSQQMKLSQFNLNNNTPTNDMMNMAPYGNNNQMTNAPNGFLNESVSSVQNNLLSGNQNLYGKFPIPQN